MTKASTSNSVAIWIPCALFMFLACASQSRPKAIEAESQSFPDAIRQICNVDGLANIADSTDELERSRQREDYIVEHTKNGDAIYFATIWRTKIPSEQAAMLKEQATRCGLVACPLADALAMQ